MNVTRQRLIDAERRARGAQQDLIASARPWGDALHRHAPTVLLGAGFAAGLSLALLPLRWWSRVGGFAFRAAARAARSDSVPALLLARAARKSVR